MKELNRIKHKQIDVLVRKNKQMFDRFLNADGILLGRTYSSERERSHHLDVVGDGYKYFIEQGVHPVELSSYVFGCFAWIAQARKEHPSVKGR